MRLGLRGRIILLVLVALAPPTAIALVVALEERSEARAHAQSDMVDSTRVVAKDVGRVIDATSDFLAAMSQELSRRPGRRYCQSLLELLPRSTNRYTAVGVAGPDGRVSCGSAAEAFGRPIRGADVSSAPWFRSARRTGRFVLGDIGVGPPASSEVLLAAQAIERGPGAPPNVLFTALDLRVLARATPLNDAPQGTSFVVLDHRGTVVARAPEDRRLVGHRLPDRPLVETVLRERQGTAEVKGLDGETRIHAFAP